MSDRAAELIRGLNLEPHPEGGYYREVFRSALVVNPDDGRGVRAALTTIYFLLPRGARSRWHRVSSDEVWHLYEGGPLELFTAPPAFDRIERRLIGAALSSDGPVAIAKAGDWQAARSGSDYSLVGCSVGPGFSFDDFSLLADEPALASRVAAFGVEALELL